MSGLERWPTQIAARFALSIVAKVYPWVRPLILGHARVPRPATSPSGLSHPYGVPVLDFELLVDSAHAFIPVCFDGIVGRVGVPASRREPRWYEQLTRDATGSGDLQLLILPVRYVSQNCVPRALEWWRYRRVVDNGQPRRTRYTLGRHLVLVPDLASACKWKESKQLHREHEGARSWLRHSPAFRRQNYMKGHAPAPPPLIATSKTRAQVEAAAAAARERRRNRPGKSVSNISLGRATRAS